jgi:hypothetical protein
MMCIMSMPLPPPHLEEFGNRQFSFFPPIRNVAGGGWLYQRVTWTEVVARHATTGQELLIPRRFVSDVSLRETTLVLGLTRELEYHHGALRPRNSGILCMPAPLESARGAGKPHSGPAPVVSIRLATEPSAQAGRKFLSAVAVGLSVCLAMLGMSRITVSHSPPAHDTPRDRNYLALQANDDGAAVMRKLGPPETANRRRLNGKLLDAMHYPSRGYSVFLAGADPGSMHYAGTVNTAGQALHGVPSRTPQRRQGF